MAEDEENAEEETEQAEDEEKEEQEEKPQNNNDTLPEEEEETRKALSRIDETEWGGVVDQWFLWYIVLYTLKGMWENLLEMSTAPLKWVQTRKRMWASWAVWHEGSELCFSDPLNCYGYFYPKSITLHHCTRPN